MEQEQTSNNKNMTLEDLLSFSNFQKLCANASDYGYGGTINDMRKKEFSRIGDTIYLDHVGTALFPESLLQKFMADLSENVYGNPHSSNLSSRLTHDTIEHVRYRILQHFNTSADDYTVIFTSGSTAALKLVADIFPWTTASSDGAGSHFCYLTDNHTSVVGIRGAMKMLNIPSIPVAPEDLLLSEVETKTTENQHDSTSHLFCYPALSNYSGTKYPLSWIEKIKSGKMKPVSVPGNWIVLLDAASFVSTSPLDLAVYQPDFVTISFYKIFGFPTGLGALIVSNQIAHLLRKNYFGGGTAAAYLSKEDFFVPKESISSRFEDGTVSFLDIIAVKHCLDTLHRLTGGMEKIRNHTHELASYTYSVLSALRYANGEPVIQVYTSTGVRTYDVQGPIINFNVLDENGGIIGYSQVDKMASLYNIHFRTGCFCNAGACQKMLGISNAEVKSNLQAGHICGDNMDIINGRPTGSIRISFGFMSTFEDAQVFLNFIVDTFIKKSSYGSAQMFDVEKIARISLFQTESNEEQSISANGNISDVGVPQNTKFSKFSEAEHICACKGRGNVSKNDKPITLSHIYLYPIKSCGAFQVSQWPVVEQGLLFDRNWMVVNENGVCLSQKQEPKLCLIRPSIDLIKNIMIIHAHGMSPIEVPLNDENKMTVQICQSKVCGDRVHTYDCGDESANWLSSFLGRKCRLIRQSSIFSRFSGAKKKGLLDTTLPSLSLVNEAQYLLVNTSSIFQLSQQIPLSDQADYKKEINVDQMTQRFRANLVINSNIPFQEEAWVEVFIGSLHFQVSGKCTRCQIICINQSTGEKSREVLQTLSSSREGKTTFGMYLQNSPCSSHPSMLKVGTEVSFTLKETQQCAQSKEESLEK
ncbi:PREDICTED: molybdenum cofactor sulfurase [Nanorana parkeri]|uniref:molybdenum cofactor sulfurase n=1 Tax=Nanorana parkeri TaxID=125878 RepID=UPI000854709C|nr:PREDICTED: molybdenum cofactor sulfurase [Nanorana parkeri]